MRNPNWPVALSDYLAQCERSRFRYGDLDCGLFVAGAIRAMTGVDVAEPLRGRYGNRATAFAAIRLLCGRATMEAAAQYLAVRYGLQEVLVLCAQRGDAVLLRKGRVSSLGIVAMHGTEILTPGARGIVRRPLSLATRAWRV